MVVALELDDAVLDDLDAAARALGSGQRFEVCERAYRQIVRTHVPRLAGDERGLFLQRRVADAILLAAITLKEPPERCEELLRECFEIGFTDLYTELEMVGAFASRCIAGGDHDRAARYLLPAIATAEAEYVKTDEPHAEFTLQLLRGVRERMNRS